MSSGVQQLVDALKHSFEINRNTEHAQKMSAYMLDQFPFYGIKAPQRRLIQREWYPLIKSSNNDFWELIQHLWNQPQREFQLTALDLLKKRSKKEYSVDDIHPLKALILQKSWWDTVDLIAGDTLGKYFTYFPEQIDHTIIEWRTSDQLWLKRSTLLFQLKYKEKTDHELLASLIEEFKSEREFFIQKAIGWSLRQYSKTNPEWVAEFLSKCRLNGIALREAKKYI